MIEPLPPLDNTPSLFSSRQRLLLAVLVAMFAAALGVRLQALDVPGVLVDRDYTSAMFARHYYFDGRPEIPEWRRVMAQKQMARQPTLEPPVTEWLASVAYRLAGREDIRLGRLLAVFFWLGGGVLLFLLARRMVGDDAGVVALAYYLFTPSAVLVSRSFQPDALMMMLFIGSLLAIVRHHQAPRRGTFMSAALVSAVTLVYRPLVMPAIVLAFVLPLVQQHGWRRGFLNRSTLVFTAIATIPAFAYYGYGAFLAKYFQWKLTSSFMFSLYGHQEFWREWFLIAVSELGLTFLVFAAAGLAFVRRGLSRTVLVALGIGYLVFGLAFTYHIHTHGYYQAQLIPAVGIAASPLVVFLVQSAIRSPERWLRGVPIVVTALIAAVWWTEIRRKLGERRIESREMAAAIGDYVNHSDRVVFLAPFYGLSLQYQGEFTGHYWPRASTYWMYRPKGEQPRNVAQRIAALGFEPEYFVITHFREYANNHEDLRRYLETRCTPVILTGEYHIYSRCQAPGDPAEPRGN